ncbi:site-specific DNA-methyltransferase, partial [Patescibacteria group bacterium]|nr:site-specific DNA-methyltransferase [Patescibacteria group bacterium]
SYIDLARYVFYTATGEKFDESKVNQSKNFIGQSKDYQIYLFYKPNLKYLKSTALTLEIAKALGNPSGKQRLVFAPTKFVDRNTLDHLHISFAQLPFEIYKLAK